ncbi:hypothetical protein Pan161_10500 [Gimesia algae]|uniref:Uncharacterized protein n=1 Tax=Gimesia algae TaxID=2527971 RepID=A0A517V8T7_9PLAN|nr:hypothetical protein Pan161_10500 [Gimesia algae]
MRTGFKLVLLGAVCYGLQLCSMIGEMKKSTSMLTVLRRGCFEDFLNQLNKMFESTSD